MYEEFYGLTERPFSLTPNPKYVFYSERYRTALDELIYGISRKEGFMLLTGDPGTGKTTLSRDLLDKLNHDKHRTALVFNPFLSGVEMLQSLLTEFGLPYRGQASKTEMLDLLNRFLLDQLAVGRTCVAIFDEAQHLAPEFLEQVRVLSNLETADEKLIQIVLVGQPELIQRIRMPGMAQLEQRVSVRCALSYLDLEETKRYVHHRLSVAGSQGTVEFSTGAIKMIHRQSEGIPRRINAIADQSLLAGYVAHTRKITPREVRKAVASLRGDEAVPPPLPKTRFRRSILVGLAVAGALLAVAAVVLFLHVRGIIAIPALPRP